MYLKECYNCENLLHVPVPGSIVLSVDGVWWGAADTGKPWNTRGGECLLLPTQFETDRQHYYK